MVTNEGHTSCDLVSSAPQTIDTEMLTQHFLQHLHMQAIKANRNHHYNTSTYHDISVHLSDLCKDLTPPTLVVCVYREVLVFAPTHTEWYGRYATHRSRLTNGSTPFTHPSHTQQVLERAHVMYVW